MSTPYTFDDENDDLPPLEDGGDAVSNLNANANYRGLASAKAAPQEFRTLGDSAKKLTTAADAIKAAADAMKSGIENAMKRPTESPSGAFQPAIPAPSPSRPDSDVAESTPPKSPESTKSAHREFTPPKSPENAKPSPREFKSGAPFFATREKFSPPDMKESYSGHGLIPGKETTHDRVDVKAKSGEFIVRPEAVKAFGVRNLEAVNAMKQKPPEMHATGGVIGKDRKDFKTPERQPRAYSVGGIVQAVSYGAQSGRWQAQTNKIGTSIIAGAASGAAAGPLGAATGAVVAGFNSVAATAKEASSRLNGFSAGLSAAKGREEQRQALGDIKRAKFLDPELSKFTDAQSKFSQTQQNVEAALMKALLPVVTPLITMADSGLKSIATIGTTAQATMADGISSVLFVLQQKESARYWREIAENTRKTAKALESQEVGGDPFMKDFLAGFGANMNESVATNAKVINALGGGAKPAALQPIPIQGGWW